MASLYTEEPNTFHLAVEVRAVFGPARTEFLVTDTFHVLPARRSSVEDAKAEAAYELDLHRRKVAAAVKATVDQAIADIARQLGIKLREG